MTEPSFLTLGVAEPLRRALAAENYLQPPPIQIAAIPLILAGRDAGAEGLLETSVPGVYAAGDVRAGSIKRCATAVGEGATVVRFVHERLSQATTSHR